MGVSSVLEIDATGFRDYYETIKGTGETVEIDSMEAFQTLSRTAEKLSIGVFQVNGTKLLFSAFQALREIRVARNALQGVGSLELADLPALVSVRFDEECCEGGRGLSLRSLPKLESVVVGARSMRGFEECVLEVLPSLKVIRIDACCFQKTHVFVLRGRKEASILNSTAAAGIGAGGCIIVSRVSQRCIR